MALISNFIAETKLNFSYSNLYRVDITKVKGKNVGLAATKFLSFLCNTAQIPGQTITTTEKALDFRSRAKGKVYDDITLSFYCTEDMKVLRFFDDWMREIVLDTNRAGFHNNYVSTIEVHKLGKGAKGKFNTQGVIGALGDNFLTDQTENTTADNEDTSITTLFEAYPKRIEPIALEYGASGAINTLSVQFAYATHTHEFLKL